MSMEPVKTALVGLKFGSYLVSSRLFGTENERFVRIDAVCDLNKDLADDFAGKHGIKKVFYDLDELLADPEIEAVMLFTPPAGRAALMRKCIASGKHVLTTKPLELDSASALEVLKEAREKGMTIHLNSPAPYPSGDLAQIRKWQKEFDLGRPVSANWETYVRYNESFNGTWFDDPRKCPAAPIFRIGIYGISELVAIFGKADSVALAESRLFTGRPTPDHAQLLMRFANGAIGTVMASFCIADGTMYPSSLTLHFERGTIRKMQLRKADSREFTSVEMSVQTIVDGKLYTEDISLPAKVRSGEYQFDMFHKSVREGVSDEETSPEEIAEGIRIIELMAEAERNLKK